MKLQWRTQGDENADRAADAASAILCDDESLAVQSAEPDTNINTLVKRFGLTDGSILPAAIDPSHFWDTTGVTDLRTALDRINQAKLVFGMLPAKIRARFGNHPAELTEWLADADNADEAIRLGLLRKPEPPPAPPPAPEPPKPTA